MFKRSSGVLMHVTSLPGKNLIGDLGKVAYEFIDFLHSADQKLWQILPLGPTGYGDSPYQSFSTFAGNPYLIDLDQLVNDKLLKEEEVEKFARRNNPTYVDYGAVYEEKLPLLKRGYERAFKLKEDELISALGENIPNKELRDRLKVDLEKFRHKNSYWLEDYTIFMALKEKFDGILWTKWPQEYKNKDEEAIKRVKIELEDEINYHCFLQYLFFKQWDGVKSYANSKGIKIIGDIPIFVALDSSDSWAHSEIFYFDEEKNPLKLAGCPPDSFSKDGQLWGNPLYNWRNVEKRDYSWWIHRVKYSFERHDIVRIDHFRGFESYWEIPNDAKSAAEGEWKKGPGIKLFKFIRKKLGKKEIIAEDLGFLTAEVKKLLAETGYPGMKVLIFAFESIKDSDYLLHKYPENSVAYTGTHDNETVVGWYNRLTKNEQEICDNYLKKIESVHSKEINWRFIEAVWGTRSVMAIAPMQDIIGLDNSARMNKPATSSGNWSWRGKEEELDEKYAKRLKELTIQNGR